MSTFDRRIAELPAPWQIQEHIDMACKSLGLANQDADPVRRKLKRRLIMRSINEMRVDLRRARELEDQ